MQLRGVGGQPRARHGQASQKRTEKRGRQGVLQHIGEVIAGRDVAPEPVLENAAPPVIGMRHYGCRLAAVRES